MNARRLVLSSNGQRGNRVGDFLFRQPNQATSLKPGAGLDQVISNCGTCHSLDYVSTQPPQRGEAFWQAEVTKMGALYGAQIQPDAGKDIIAYLAANY